MDDSELREIKRLARRNRMTVAEWVRQALRAARRQESLAPTDRKLSAVREAAHHQYPAGSVAEMLQEIERGYAGDDGE
jgi:hypothetical protein